MVRFVALLRGINVGRAKRIAMGDLRKQLADLGYENVRTVLNSGNAIFDARAEPAQTVAARIVAMLPKRLEVSAHVVALRAGEVVDTVSSNPLRGVATDPSRLLLAFVQERAVLDELLPLTKRSWKPEAL